MEKATYNDNYYFLTRPSSLEAKRNLIGEIEDQMCTVSLLIWPSGQLEIQIISKDIIDRSPRTHMEMGVLSIYENNRS